MTKDELKRYGSITAELRDIQKQLDKLEETKGCHSVSYGDLPHTRGDSIAEEQRYVEKKDELEQLYRQKEQSLLEEQRKIETAIDSLPPDLRRLMRYRYIDCMTCEQVCVEMPCAWMTFHRWHSKALTILKDGIE